MSVTGVRLQMPDVLSSAQLKTLELKSLTTSTNLCWPFRGLTQTPRSQAGP